VLLRLAADHLLDDHGLAHAGPAEHPDLAALHVGLEQVDDLDPGLEHHLPRLELLERRRLTVDRPAVGSVDLVRCGVEGIAKHVVDVPEHTLAHRHADRRSGVLDGRAADHAVGWLEGDRPDHPVADVLRHLAGDRLRLALQGHVDPQRRVDLGQPSGGNSTSTTGPITRATRPCASVSSAMSHSLEARASAPPTISMISVVISS
jgi:hypothetical protein